MKKMKNIIFILILLLFSCTNIQNNIIKKEIPQSTQENNTNEKVNWIKLEEAFDKAQKENKYVMLSFYVDWCQFCKKLNTEVYFDEKLYKYLNEKFISVKINAESEELIKFKNKNITKKTLAKLFGVEGYPNIFFLDTEDKILGKIPSLLSAKDFYISASYIGNNAYKTISLQEHKERMEILEF